MTRSRLFVNDVEERNVMLLLKNLINLFLENMVCRECQTVHTMEICAETMGIATKISIACKNPVCRKCDQWSVMEPSTVKLDDLIDKNCDPYDIKQTGNHNTRRYQLNLDLNLAMQMIGGGGSDYALIASISAESVLHPETIEKDSFTSNEETMGMHIIDMAEKVVEDNLNDENLHQNWSKVLFV
jgi:hypothetical protein